jgi:hypothetical protein
MTTSSYVSSYESVAVSQDRCQGSLRTHIAYPRDRSLGRVVSELFVVIFLGHGSCGYVRE